MSRINIIIGDLTMEVELNDSVSAGKIREGLPISVSFDTWGMTSTSPVAYRRVTIANAGISNDKC